jgi:hypothetical protein
VRTVTKRRFRLLFLVLYLSVVIGATIGGAIGSMHGAPLFHVVLGALSGAITAAILAVMIGGAEVFVPQTRLGRALDGAPFVYSGAIVLVLESMVGRRLASVLLVGPQSAHELEAT